MNENIVVRRWGVAAVLAALAVGMLAACSDGSNETTAPTTATAVRSYVGTAQGTAALVSVVVDGSRALAYLCDGVPADPTGTAPTIQAWFNGPSDGKASTCSSRPGGSSCSSLGPT